MQLTSPKAMLLGIAIGAGGVTVFYGMDESDTASPSTDTSAPYQPESQKHERLQTKLQKTRERLELAQQSLAAREQPASSSPQAAQPSSQSSIDYQANAEAVQKHVNQMVERANKTGQFNLAEQASNAFEKAPRDERWADQHERDLQNAFATEQPLQGAIVQATECKTHRCRITLFYQSKDEIGEVSERLTRLFSHSDDYDFVPASSVYFEDDGETATIFVADDIKQLNTGVGNEPDE